MFIVAREVYGWITDIRTSDARRVNGRMRWLVGWAVAILVGAGIFIPFLQDSTWLIIVYVVGVWLYLGSIIGGLAAYKFPDNTDNDWLNKVRDSWARIRVVVIAFLLALTVFTLWFAADLAGNDVLRTGNSTRTFPPGPGLPILRLLGLSPFPVSPCLIHLPGDQQKDLYAAVIVGHSGGRTYLVGLAGSAGFEGVPAGHAITFSVADADLGALDLEPTTLPWKISGPLIPAPCP